MLSRRLLFSSAIGGGTLGFLAACSKTGTPMISLQQAINDALSIAQSIQAQLPTIAKFFPNALTVPVATLNGWLTSAIAALNAASGSADAASNLKTAEQYINMTLNALSAVAQALSTTVPQAGIAVLVIQSAITLEVPIEALLNSLFAPSTGGTASGGMITVPASALAQNFPAMSPEGARANLRLFHR